MPQGHEPNWGEVTTEARLKAVVLLSGGLDSAVVAAQAKSQGYHIAALSLDYGQRHQTELSAASRVAAFLGIKDHRVVRVDLSGIGGSALTSTSIAVPKHANPDAAIDPTQVPVTYVPARNTIFLAIALGFAETLGAFDLFYGANALDYSGYPDCRPAFVSAFETLANVATREACAGHGRFRVHAPLISLHKHEIIRRGLELGVDFALTHSCYDPVGDLACGRCDACVLRHRGFIDAKISDPTRYVTSGA
ncbi:MAG: 7-cyano-7-deazaguanine synthase QueC [Deltaproteobacteria bacterium]|nr:7-cyano-7-deazaguanine synthase QueC [Deltaproteobacteria bacterium]